MTYEQFRSDAVQQVISNFHVEEGPASYFIHNSIDLQSLYKQYQESESWQCLFRHFYNFDAIRDSLIFALRNNYRYKLEPFRKFDDFTFVLYSVLKQEDYDHMLIPVPRDAMKHWNIPDEEIFNFVLDQTERLYPPRLYGSSSSEMFEPDYKGEEFMPPAPLKYFEKKSLIAPTISTEYKHDGAIAIFYPGVMERVAKMSGGNFYLCLGSESDAHIQPVDGFISLREIKSSLKNMNRKSPKEMLTRHVYLYDAGRHQLRRA